MLLYHTQPNTPGVTLLNKVIIYRGVLAQSGGGFVPTDLDQPLALEL